MAAHEPIDDGRTALEIRGSGAGLLDDPLLLRVRGAGGGESPTWRARMRDDAGLVWRAAAPRAEDLSARWSSAKVAVGAVAALQSLRPVTIDVRVEAADGRSASRALVRRLVDEGVRVRRWRDGLTATLHLPASGTPCATVVLDATGGPGAVQVATLAAPLLASRGVLALAVVPGRGDPPAAAALSAAVERLASVPGAASEPVILPAIDPGEEVAAEPGRAVVLPPGVPRREPQGAEGALARARAWDALLDGLGARPRERP